MIQSRIELFFKFIARFDLIDKEIPNIDYRKSQLVDFNDKNLMKLNYFINEIIQFNDFWTLIKLELVFQQKIFKNKSFNTNELNSFVLIHLNLQKKLFFHCLELQLCTLFLIIGLNFSNKKVLLDKRIVAFVCSNSNSCFFYFLSTKLKKYNISTEWFFPTQLKEYQTDILSSYYFIKPEEKKGE